jgi:uncharacterized protein
MKRFAILGLAALATLACIARAEDDLASRQQSAEELLRTMNLERVTMAGMSAALEMQLQKNPALLPYRDVYLTWARKHLTWNAIGPKLAAVYAESFTESELRDLIAFYKTPTGQKALTEFPILYQKGAEVGQKVAKDHVEDLENMIRERATQLEQAPQPPEPKPGGP